MALLATLSFPVEITAVTGISSIITSRFSYPITFLGTCKDTGLGVSETSDPEPITGQIWPR
jgi:hypothetical protein